MRGDLTSGMGGLLGALIAGAFVVVAAACADPHGPGEQKPPPEPPGTGTPGLVLTLHGAATDTVTAPPDTLEAVLSDDKGHPVSGTTIVFSVPDPGAGVAIALVGPLGSESTQLIWTVTTDATGHARARLWRTNRPGSGWVYAKAASSVSPPPSDSVRVTTTAGKATALNVQPKDTVLNQGQSFTVTSSPTDRFGNATTATVVLEAQTTGLRVDAMTLTALATPGRHQFIARSGTLFEVGHVDIIPPGTLAVRDLRTEGFAFATFGTDGSRYTPFVATVPPESYGGWNRDLSLQWAPSGDWLVFSEVSGAGTTALFRTTLAGVVTRIPFTSPTGQDLNPQISSDGAWIYFQAMPNGLLESWIYRVHPDGSGLERVSAPSGGVATNDLFPSPSPDGRFIVYATDRESGVSQPRLQLLELASGTITSLGVEGNQPRWSPTGEWIAFSRGSLVYVVHPDGTGLRRLSADFTGYVSPVGWSPDGRWIAAEQYGKQIDVIEVATGVTIPLKFTSDLAGPVWRPN